MYDRYTDIEYLPMNHSSTADSKPKSTSKIIADKQPLLIASKLIEMLMENFDEEDAYASRSKLIENVRKEHNFTPGDDELSNAVKLINSISPANSNIVREKWTGNFLNPAVYISSYEVKSLKLIYDSINKALGGSRAPL